jgi:hypothetical protein
MTMALAGLCACLSIPTEAGNDFDAAAAFGARPSTEHLSLSPDGKQVAFMVPAKGQGSVLYTIRLEKGAKHQRALLANGHPYRLRYCDWVSNERLACQISWTSTDLAVGPASITRLVAVDWNGTHLRMQP